METTEQTADCYQLRQQEMTELTMTTMATMTSTASQVAIEEKQTTVQKRNATDVTDQ